MVLKNARCFAASDYSLLMAASSR